MAVASIFKESVELEVISTISLPVGRVGFSNQGLVSFNTRGGWDDGKRSHGSHVSYEKNLSHLLLYGG